MARKILIMGLPGSGKTTLAKKLAPMFNAVWLNADKVREEANDWDFSEMGRTIQANRMKRLAQEALDNNRNVIADFVCPTRDTRKDIKRYYCFIYTNFWAPMYQAIYIIGMYMLIIIQVFIT